MKEYIIKRILLLFPTLLGISLVTFMVMQLAPGDPVSLNQGGMMSNKMSVEVIEKVREMYGLNDPLIVQYGNWLKRIVTFDFGNSFQNGEPVLERIASRLPITLLINIITIVLIYLIAIPIGVFSAKYHNTKYEKATTLALFLMYSLPSFWVGLLLIVFFGVFLDLLPIYGIVSDGFSDYSFMGKVGDLLSHIILPVITLVYGGLAYISKFVKNGLLEEMQEDYVTLARAKGIKENVILWKHAFRNSMIPIVTILATTLPALIGGSVIIESIYSLPGIGLLYYEAILARDYPIIMTLSFITAFLTLISLILADILYVVVDPRINFNKK